MPDSPAFWHFKKILRDLKKLSPGCVPTLLKSFEVFKVQTDIKIQNYSTYLQVECQNADKKLSPASLVYR